jgi:rare lipoprotein A (peptidoglycan hydrolase)
MKRWIGIVMLLVPLCVSAQSFWDGNATVQRGDAGFESGPFAVSNSFPPDSRIVVQNLDTGQSVTATVTRRIDGQSDVLLLLSPMAASSIGLSQGAMARVRVTLAAPVPTVPRASTSQPQEQVASRDPDINPGAAYPQSAQKDISTGSAGTTPAAAEAQPSEESLPASVAQQQAATSLPPVNSPEAPQPEVAHAEVTQPDHVPAQTATAAAASAAEAAAARQKADEAAIIAAAQSRKPQKQLFLPPREDERFAYHKPTVAPAQTAANTTPETQQTTPTAPRITAVIGEPNASPAPQQAADLALADAVAPQESAPQEIVGAETAGPSGEPAGAEIALAEPEPVAEPLKPVQTEVTGPVAAPAPGPKAPQLALAAPQAPPERAHASPQTAQTATAQTPQQTAPRQVPAATTLKSTGSAAWYLQLAAYTTEQIAQDLAKSLVPTYPTVVLAPQPSGARMFRVVIGPLNRAESGTLLTWFRYRGFPDAFLKQN